MALWNSGNTVSMAIISVAWSRPSAVWTTATGIEKVLGGGECCHSTCAVLRWWDDVMDRTDKNYSTRLLQFSHSMLRREILGTSKALWGATTVSDPAVSFAYCFKSSGRAVNKAFDRVRKERKLNSCNSREKPERKPEGERKDAYAVWGFLRHIALWVSPGVTLGTCFAQLLRTESYFETTSLCLMIEHIIRLWYHACNSFKSLLLWSPN